MEVGGIVVASTADDVDEHISAHENANNVKFIRLLSTKAFGSSDWLSRCDNRDVLWNRVAAGTGCSVPYMSIGQLVFTCGSCYKRLAYTAGDVLIDDDNSQPPEAPFIQLPKSRCDAKVFCKEIVSFPRFKIEPDEDFGQQQVSNALKAAIGRREKMPDAVRHFEIMFPAKSAHDTHCNGPTSEVQNVSVELGPAQDAVIVLSSDESECEEHEDDNDTDLKTDDLYLNSATDTDDFEREIEEFYGVARAKETEQRLLLAAKKLFGVEKHNQFNERSPSPSADCGAAWGVSESTTAVKSGASLHAVAYQKENEENEAETGTGGTSLHIDQVYSLLDDCDVKKSKACANQLGAVGRSLSSEGCKLVDAAAKRANRCTTFTCIYCGQLFRKKKSLASHVLFHTEEQPFRCLLCNLSFRGFGVRCRCAAAAAADDAPSDEFSCQCTLCGKKFYTWKQLTYHVLADLLKRPDKYGMSTIWRKTTATTVVTMTASTTTKKKKKKKKVRGQLRPAADDSNTVNGKCSTDCNGRAVGRESNGQPPAAAAFRTLELEFSDSEFDIMYI